MQELALQNMVYYQVQTSEKVSERQALEQAQVIYLLYNHTLHEPAVFSAYCLFHEKILHALYQEGDIILLEEDASLPNEKLTRNFIPHLDRLKYSAEGWDSPECCKNTCQLYDLDARINKVLQKVQPFSPPKKVEIYEWDIFLSFAQMHSLGTLSKEEITAYLNERLPPRDKLKLEQKIQLVSLKCRIQLEKMKKEHILTTFQTRQDSLGRCIQKHRNKKRIFVLAGKNHANPTQALFKPIIEKHLHQLDTSFAIIDPKFNCD